MESQRPFAARCEPDRRLICHFPQDNAIISVGSGYSGNVLLSKKYLALGRSYLARKQSWLAEHMLTQVESRKAGSVRRNASRAPGRKTNFAMLIPPAHFKGWKVPRSAMTSRGCRSPRTDGSTRSIRMDISALFRDKLQSNPNDEAIGARSTRMSP
jgi:hypothetical protein